jgi:hypothetical protein
VLRDDSLHRMIRQLAEFIARIIPPDEIDLRYRG